ncbi:trehalose operon repressor [Enterococcus columbae]|uniref:Trehalose operon repressor n=1 Tax=Enterococcus columbae DSM 7374 = ATCC 51263 TaxID=1121865 RepID=S0KHC3_9ENTE|nr:trehalose operon repressor [Enterococcus columbae]EOT38556.1 trehalose operon repressor [Enterococcus columbae DSM 7374 = ATCC 51263]EOW87793.1 trehalose operon repressor [Enterococcus columbae DSM 7374 = ATCC 51263]OJG22671.1 trehalose operon repressor [Enterococcus columbae DSM 7374 = ATCC 51263]
MNKFKEIFADLEQKILNGVYPANSLLPSENQMMEQYHVSRETVRKALNLLRNAGYIQKKQGKGSIVLDLHRFDFPISGLTSFKELQEKFNMDSKTEVIEIKKIAVSPNLSERTGWPVAAEVWKLVRRRVINGEPSILDVDYLDAQIIPTLPEKKVEESLYRFFEEDLGLEISYAQKEITVDNASKKVRDLLNLTMDDHHVVTVRSLVYLYDMRCFEYTESIHRLDKFRFVDFARRTK